MCVCVLYFITKYLVKYTLYKSLLQDLLWGSIKSKLLCCINDYSIYKHLIHNQQFRRTENLYQSPATLSSYIYINITVSLICLKSLFAYRAYFSVRAEKRASKIEMVITTKRKTKQNSMSFSHLATPLRIFWQLHN